MARYNPGTTPGTYPLDGEGKVHLKAVPVYGWLTLMLLQQRVEVVVVFALSQHLQVIISQ